VAPSNQPVDEIMQLEPVVQLAIDIALPRGIGPFHLALQRQ
jgi:hypothetical protein